jgi:hypothetical protein
VPAAIVITLPVCSPAEARLGEDLFLDLPLLAQRHLRFEDIDFLAPVLGDLPGKLFFPRQ